ncbi:hypothetical protein BDZ97DRAFT_142201 [Flammula alnicola]|nr:hypothetical protein BDZ97DRAFT_142201 [Flammula alnicola]
MAAQTFAQTINFAPAQEKPHFSFLAKPPPPRKKRPSQGPPLPPPRCSPPPVPTAQLNRRRSNTYCGIHAWAAHVQPGSPAPRSPHRRPSITSNSSRRSSISRLNRRPSITHSRTPSGSFIHIIDTPTRTQYTPSVADFDLTALGYTSVFVQFPKTPTTPSPYLRQYHQRHEQHCNVNGAPSSKPLSPGPLSASAFAHIPIPPIPSEDAAPKRKGMKRFRSLSILRPRSSKSKSQAPTSPCPISPTKTSISTKSSKPAKRQQSDNSVASITKRKQAKYAYKYVRPPPPLANELAMMQFADGGSMESNIKRVMEGQAKAAKGSGAGVGVADVYRDGEGGIWWDADEEMEYAPLLGEKTVQEAMKEGRDDEMEMQWEEFDAGAAKPVGHAASPDVVDTARRSSVSTQDSDLDLKYLVPLPENEDPRMMTVDDRVLASRRIGGPGLSVLSVPSRPRRAAMHLHKPGFLVDVAAFGPRSPSAGAKSTASFIATSSSHATKSRGKARRRPAPLKLASSAHAVVVVRSRRSPGVQATVASSPTRRIWAAPATVAVSSPGGVERTRREFIEDSFAPLPLPPTPAPARVPLPILIATSHGVGDSSAAKTSRRGGVLGLFAIARRAD